MKTLEDERYMVIKAYKCAVSEIWRDFFVLACIACTSYPYRSGTVTVSLTCICMMSVFCNWRVDKLSVDIQDL